MNIFKLQRQIVKTNATFNAYLMNGTPNINRNVIPVSMTRYLVLEDDMKEYWGFYLLQGSSVTVSTCVRYTFVLTRDYLKKYHTRLKITQLLEIIPFPDE
jgi:hypothetical protein